MPVIWTLPGWRFHFEGGSAEEVAKALAFYQNEDGGFGHGLELDCQNPHSQPVQFFWGAAGILAEIGCNTPEHPIMKRFLTYLESCPDITERGIRFAIPSNNEYPCNRWYLYVPGQTPAECNINSGIGLIFEHLPPASPLYQKALRIADYRLSVMRDVLIARLEATKDIWQGLEPSDYASLILALKKHRVKTERECRALYDRLLDIVKEYGAAQTYAMLSKQIGDGTGVSRMDEITGEDELDAVVDALSGDDQPWNSGGRLRDGEDSAQKCADYHIGSLWWPVKNAIHSMKLLKAHGRIEIPGL